ncbi:MAG: SDR family oxidoreductase [Burkholderiales bacterium]|nr:MAG: SDR family oxidoreductase [Burkholderiales bacterium]
MTTGVALVTGAGGSIGACVAAALADAGFAVAVNDLDANAAERTVAALSSKGCRTAAFVADVGDSAAVRDMVGRIEQELGPVAVLVNNAGKPGKFTLLVDMSDELWSDTLRVHLFGAFHLIRDCGRRMLRRGSGRIVNVASLAGTHGTVGSAEYAAAKAGLINLTRTAAKELGPFGITVNAIAPGMVATPVNRELQTRGSGFIDAALQGMPGGRLVAPSEIAALVVFLASEAAANVNGATIPVDGGGSVCLSTDVQMSRYLTARSAYLREIGHASAG